MAFIAAWTILIPFLGGGLLFLLARRATVPIGILTALATLVVASWSAWQVWGNGPQEHAIGGWASPLGVVLYLDGLSSLMLVMTAIVMSLLAIYAMGYFSHSDTGAHWREKDSFYVLWLFLFGALNALFLSRDIFNLYVLLELVTLAGVGLVVIAGGRVALMAGMRYLLAAFLGSLLYLFGVALLYASVHTLDIYLIAQRIEAGPTETVAVVLITLGLMIKTALFPFHAWLPHAHANAPAPVSAMLSALVVKASFYLVLRLWVEVFPASVTVATAQAVGFLGAAGILWGSVQALREERLKLVVAHSTVAQVGFLFLLVPLITVPVVGPETAGWQASAWSGGVYHILSHAFAKAALFLCAGTLLYALGSDRLQGMRGMSITMPVTTFAFGIAGIALIGLPPSGSFIAKWLMLTSAIGTAQWWWVSVIGIGTLLSGAYVFRLMRQAFAPAEMRLERRVPRSMELTSLALALVALTLGLRAAEPLKLLEAGAPLFLQMGGGG